MPYQAASKKNSNKRRLHQRVFNCPKTFVFNRTFCTGKVCDPYTYKYEKGAIFGLKLHRADLKTNLINIVFISLQTLSFW